MAKGKIIKRPEIERMGMHASGLLSNPSFKAAVDAVRGTYTHELIHSAPEESAKREHLHKCIHALNDIETALTAFVQSGKIETSMLLKQEKAKK